jgi:hypothetical protein
MRVQRIFSTGVLLRQQARDRLRTQIVGLQRETSKRGYDENISRAAEQMSNFSLLPVAIDLMLLVNQIDLNPA